MVQYSEQNNSVSMFPEFIDGEVGNIEFDFIAGKLSPEFENTFFIASEWIAIICHPHPMHGGTKDNKVVHTLCRASRDLGIDCFRFNFRGVGMSEGSFSEGRGEYKDLSSVINFVKNHYGAEQKILLAGFSFGAYIAAKYASLHQVAALVLVAPPVQYPDFVKRNALKSSVFIVQGSVDEIVSTDSVTQWAGDNVDNASISQLLILNEASHFFHGRLSDLKMSVQDFVLRLS